MARPKHLNKLPVGTTFSDWTVVGELIPHGDRWKVPCRCKCGKEKLIGYATLQSGHSTRCRSCARREGTGPVRHGMAKSSEYSIWNMMLQRCNNPNCDSYPSYGGRGIVVCERWLLFDNFISDMGGRPSRRHSIDRKDNSGPYAPWNCRWATAKEQQNNKRNVRRVVVNGESLTLSEASEKFGIPHKTIWGRLRKGWDDVAAATTPLLSKSGAA